MNSNLSAIDFVFDGGKNYMHTKSIVEESNSWLLSIAFKAVIDNLNDLVESIFKGYNLPLISTYEQFIALKCRHFTSVISCIVIDEILKLDGYSVKEKSLLLEKIHVINCRVDGIQHCFLVIDGFSLDFTFRQFSDDVDNVMILDEELILRWPFITDVEIHNAMHWVMLDGKLEMKHLFI